MRMGFLPSRTMAAVWALLGAACAQDGSTPSVPTAPSPQGSTVTLTGTAVDEAGALAGGDAVVDFHVEP